MMNGFGMWSSWLIPIILIIGVFYFLNNSKKEPSAKDILDIRYAKGEIDKNEYEEKIKDLK